jgi:hypothetical protein
MPSYAKAASEPYPFRGLRNFHYVQSEPLFSFSCESRCVANALVPGGLYQTRDKHHDGATPMDGPARRGAEV